MRSRLPRQLVSAAPHSDHQGSTRGRLNLGLPRKRAGPNHGSPIFAMQLRFGHLIRYRNCCISQCDGPMACEATHCCAGHQTAIMATRAMRRIIERLETIRLETGYGLLRSRSRAHTPTLDMEHSHLGRCDCGWRLKAVYLCGGGTLRMPSVRRIAFLQAAVTSLIAYDRSALADIGPCRSIAYERALYAVCEVDLHKHTVRLYWNRKGLLIRCTVLGLMLNRPATLRTLPPGVLQPSSEAPRRLPSK
jgi:hypothetical protein